MSETAILKAILAALCKEYAGIGLFYRRNTGGMEKDGFFVRFGLPGMADVGAIIQGQSYEIEVKSDKGKQSPEQRNWQRAVERAGGIYILARSVDDCLKQVASHRLRLASINPTRPDA